MHTAYLVVTAFLAAGAAFSALAKIRRDPRVVAIIHDVVGVPMSYFGLLASLELAGAIGIVAGIWLKPLGLAAGAGLVLYFVGAAVSHLRVSDIKGIGPALFMLATSIASVVLRWIV
jgi:DoxX-like family